MKRAERARLKRILAITALIGVGTWIVAKSGCSSCSAWGAKLRGMGGVDTLKGKAKEAAGRVLGNDALSAEGLVNQAVGAVRAGTGKVVSAAREAVS